MTANRRGRLERLAEDAVIAALDDAALGDFFRFLTPSAISGSMVGSATLSPETVRRHFSQGPGEVAAPGQLRALAAVDGIAFWLFPPGSELETLVAPVDFVEALFQSGADRSDLVLQGVQSTLALAVGTASSDLITRTAVRRLFDTTVALLSYVLPEEPDLSQRTRDLATLRFAQSWAICQWRDAAAVASVVRRLVSATLPAGIYEAPPVSGEPLAARVSDLFEQQRWPLTRAVDGERHAHILLAMYQLIGDVGARDLFAFLTPTFVMRYAAGRIDRTTLAYHLSKPGQPRRTIGLDRVVKVVNNRLTELGLANLSGYHKTSSRFSDTAIEAKHRLLVAAAASADSWADIPAHDLPVGLGPDQELEFRIMIDLAHKAEYVARVVGLEPEEAAALFKFWENIAHAEFVTTVAD